MHRKGGSVFPLGKNSTNSDIYLTRPRNHAGARLRFAWHKLLRAPARQHKDLPWGSSPKESSVGRFRRLSSKTQCHRSNSEGRSAGQRPPRRRRSARNVCAVRSVARHGLLYRARQTVHHFARAAGKDKLILFVHKSSSHHLCQVLDTAQE